MNNPNQQVNIMLWVRIPVILIIIVVVLGCESPGTSTEELKRYPIANLEEILTRSGVSLDTSVTSDGNGALKIVADQPTTVRLFEVRNLNVENARLFYQARLRTEEVEGQVYLEMWCHFPGLGEFFSRGLHAPLSGSVEWTTQEIPFFLQQGQNPEVVKLNVVVNGKGTAWIDDIILSKGTLE
jgi:hypothetical protein